MRGSSNARRQAAVIGAVLVAAVAVPKALADGVPGVPVDGAALAQAAIDASTPVVPAAPPTPIVPPTVPVPVVTPVIPEPVSPPPPPPPPVVTPSEAPQTQGAEPQSGGAGTQPAAQRERPKRHAKISRSITPKARVIPRAIRPDKAPKTESQSCSRSASCQAPITHPQAVAAASARGGARELPPPGVTAAGLARGREHVRPHSRDKDKPARRSESAGAHGAPTPLVPPLPGRSPEAPPPASVSFSSPGAHGTGSFTVSASVSAPGVPAAHALGPPAHLASVPSRGRESDDRLDRPG
jgi:hypothetical protein